jgi:hypothetical protein
MFDTTPAGSQPDVSFVTPQVSRRNRQERKRKLLTVNHYLLDSAVEERIAYQESLAATMKQIPEMYFGEWKMQYEVISKSEQIPEHVPKNRIWTQVTGQGFNGSDVDLIVPGVWDEIGVFYYVTAMPHAGGKMIVHIYHSTWKETASVSARPYRAW